MLSRLTKQPTDCPCPALPLSPTSGCSRTCFLWIQLPAMSTKSCFAVFSSLTFRHMCVYYARSEVILSLLISCAQASGHYCLRRFCYLSARLDMHLWWFRPLLLLWVFWLLFCGADSCSLRNWKAVFLWGYTSVCVLLCVCVGQCAVLSVFWNRFSWLDWLPKSFRSPFSVPQWWHCRSMVLLSAVLFKDGCCGSGLRSACFTANTTHWAISPAFFPWEFYVFCHFDKS